MKTLTPLRPVTEQVRDLSGAILAERERETARHGDTAWNCEKFHPALPPYACTWGYCEATPMMSSMRVEYDCPQTCPCFRRRP
jgi:hypothetical protein